MNNPLSPYVQSIEQILASRDAYTPNRLFDAYRTAGSRDAFVAALIGRLLVETNLRKGSAP